MAMQSRGSGGESNYLGQEFEVMGAQATPSTTQKKTGTYGIRLQYDNNLANPANAYVQWVIDTSNNFSTQFQLYIATTPLVDITLMTIGYIQLTLGTDRKITIKDTSNSNSAVSTNAVAATTWTQIEVANKRNTTAYLRINEAAEANIVSSDTTFNSATYGGSTAKNVGPAADLYIDDIALLYGADDPYWLNTTYPTYRTVDANGTYQDFICNPTTANHYTVVDDYIPYSTADYSQNNAYGTFRETEGCADLTITDTIKGVVVNEGIIPSNYMQANGGDTYHALIRDNATDYEGTQNFINPTYYFARTGYDSTRPSGTAWTSAAINALEVGVKVVTTKHDWSAIENGSEKELPNADSATDNSWAASTGVNKWACVDETWAAPDYTDYISTSTANARQAFTYADFSAYTTPASCVYVMSGGKRTSGTDNGYYKLYLLIGGTRYYGNYTQGPLTDSWTGWYDYWTVDPSTGQNWTIAGLNAAEIGVESQDTVPKAVGIIDFNLFSTNACRLNSIWVVTLSGDATTAISWPSTGGNIVWPKISPNSFWGPF